MKKIYVLLILLAVLLVSGFSYSFLKPKYPDIWGYQLEDTKLLKLRKNSLSAYKTDKGEIYFIIDKSYEKYQDNEGVNKYKNEIYTLLNFFTGETKEINSDQRNSFKQDYHAKWLIGSHESWDDVHAHSFSKGYRMHTLSNGNIIEWEDSCGKNNLNHRINLLDKNGKLIKSVGVFSVYDEPIKEYYVATCDDNETEEKPDFLQVVTLVNQVLFLDDDSFIIYDYSGINVLLRMDKNLETKFVSNHKVKLANGKTLKQNVFIIPDEELTPISQKTNNSYYGIKETYNNLYNYLYEKSGE